MGLAPIKGALSGAVLFVCLAAGSAIADKVLSHRDDLSAKDREKAAGVLQFPTDFEKPEKFEVMQGGAGTSTKKPDRDAYAHSNPKITSDERLSFRLGCCRRSSHALLPGRE
ncbi:MAG: hypothetical protein AAGA50_17990, partial [Pseudomonadota bacterium]